MKEKLAGLTVFDQTAAETILAINRFSPRTREGRVVSTSEDFWRQPPYFHEKVIVSVWVCLAERMAKEGLSRADAEDFIKVTEWVYFLKKEQVEAERPGGREESPPLFSFNDRVGMEGILIRTANRETFFGNEDWRKIIIASARKLTMSLNSIFRVSPLEEERNIVAEAKKLGID